MTDARISVIIPARDEQASIAAVVESVIANHPEAEVIVVDDGSQDATADLARAAGARVIQHSSSRGNGASVKSGVRAARTARLIMMDADGQHRADQIQSLLDALDAGNELAVGSRSASAHANVLRRMANGIYNRLASWLTGTRILDLTSGFRAANASRFRAILPLLPNGFSYPTTSTMAFLRAGHGVAFVPVQVDDRSSDRRSHIRPLVDGSRFLAIIFKVATLYSPLKIFLPISAVLFATGCAYYGHTYATGGRFTNMGVLLLLSSVFVGLIGMVSEQVTTLIHLAAGDDGQPADDH